MSIFSSLTSYLSSAKIASIFSSKKNSTSVKLTDAQDLIVWIRENIHDQQVAEEMYLDLIKENPFYLANLEHTELTQKLCSTAFAMDPSVKDLIPSNFFTEKMHQSLYLNDANYFKNLPDSMKSKDLCLLAVKDNVENLKYVPEDMKTRDILKAAFNNLKDKKNT